MSVLDINLDAPGLVRDYYSTSVRFSDGSIYNDIAKVMRYKRSFEEFERRFWRCKPDKDEITETVFNAPVVGWDPIKVLPDYTKEYIEHQLRRRININTGSVNWTNVKYKPDDDEYKLSVMVYASIGKYYLNMATFHFVLKL